MQRKTEGGMVEVGRRGAERAMHVSRNVDVS